MSLPWHMGSQGNQLLWFARINDMKCVDDVFCIDIYCGQLRDSSEQHPHAWSLALCPPIDWENSDFTAGVWPVWVCIFKSEDWRNCFLFFAESLVLLQIYITTIIKLAWSDFVLFTESILSQTGNITWSTNQCKELPSSEMEVWFSHGGSLK